MLDGANFKGQIKITIHRMYFFIFFLKEMKKQDEQPMKIIRLQAFYIDFVE